MSRRLAYIDVQSAGIWPIRTLQITAKDYVTNNVVATASTSGFEGNSPAFTKICQDLDRRGYKLSNSAWEYAQAELRLDYKTFAGYISDGTDIAKGYVGK
jgi:hypothetical protein